MKLRNKKTGEIVEKYPGRFIINSGEQIRQYDSLSGLNAEWEDYEEPKEYWYIESDGSIIQNHKPTYINHLLDGLKSIGNYFDTREEAEKAVEKLKAWKRLKDKGLNFSINKDEMKIIYDFGRRGAWATEVEPDLEMLFGGEE